MNALLQQIVTSPELLRQGDTILAAALKQPQNRKSLLTILYQNQNRNYLVLIQNVYPDIWDQLDHAEKQFTRQALLKMLHERYHVPKDIEALGLFVNKIHNKEGYEHWESLYLQLIGLGLSEQLLEYFLIVYRNQDDRIANINAALMQQLIISLQNTSASPVIIQKLVILMYYIVKSSSSMKDINDELFNSTITRNSAWLLTVYQNILASDQIHLHKLILQQLTVLFSNAPKFCFTELSPLVNQVWMYFNNLVPVYLNENVLKEGQEKPKSISDEYIFGVRYDEEVTVSEGLVYQCLELIEAIFLYKSMKKLMRFAVYPLFSVLNALLLITKRDEKEWIEQENKFIADNEDEDVIGVRNRIISFINILVEDRYKGVIDVLKLVINNGLSNGNLSTLKQTFKQDIIEKKIMTQLDQKLLSQSEFLQQIFDKSFVDIEVNPELIKESATLLLCSFSSDILSTISNKNAIFQKLRIEVEQSKYPLLRIQSLNTIVKCSEKIDADQIPNFLQYAFSSLNSEFVGLKVISVKAIGVLCRKLRLSPVETNHIRIEEVNIQSIMNLVTVFARETIHVFIDTLIQLTNFSPQTKQSVIKCIQPLIGNLIEIALTDGLISSQLIELFGEASSVRIQQFFFNKLDQYSNIKGSEQAVEFLAKILETNLQNQIFMYQNTEQINLFILKNVNNPNLECLIRELLRSTNISQQALHACVQNIKPMWFIPLHQRGVTLDIIPILKKSVQSVIQLMSPSEVEQELTLPFYLMWYNFESTISVIRSFGLYDQFVSKWLRYQEAFKGIVLKKVSLKLTSHLPQQQYQQQVNTYIAKQRDYFLKEKEMLSKLEPQWEDEDVNDDDEEDQTGENFGGLNIDDDGWLDGDLVNKIVERQLICAIKGIESVSIDEIISSRSQPKI